VSYLYFRSPAQALRDGITALCGATSLLNQVIGVSPAPPTQGGAGQEASGEEKGNR